MKGYVFSALALTCMYAGAVAPAAGDVASRLSAGTRAVARTAAPACAVVSGYITVDPSVCSVEALESAGASVSLRLDSMLTARFPLDAVESLAAVEGVKYIQVSAPATQMLDVASGAMGMDRVHLGTGLPRAYTGKGVVVGIVDSGFDYGHAAFRGVDGSLRIRRVWDQASQGASPEGFGYGLELTTPEEILAAGGDIRNNSHGTHVASIAAGADYNLGGTLGGMAPDADIVLVSMTQPGGGNANISDAIAYIFSYADEVDKPCVVNLSLGSFSGPHDGTSSFDVIADGLQGPGRLIVGASGNNRAEQYHLHRSFDGADSAPLRSFIDYKHPLSDKYTGSEIDLWAQSGTDIEVALLAVKVSSGEVVQRTVVYPAETPGENSVSLGRNVSGTFSVASEVSPLNGKTHVVLASYITSIRTGYAIAVEVTAHSAGEVDLWADNSMLAFSSRDVEGYSSPAGESTICEIGGTARRILTVGAYTTRSSFRLLGENEFRNLNETDGDLCSFSSCGPTADGRMKPQVTAPGCFISAAVSNNDQSGTLSLSAFTDAGGRDNLYGFMQGTSMASPMMAGTVATWLEAYPELTPELLVDVVRSTASTDIYTGDVSDGSNLWGYGKADGLAGLRECLRLAGVEGIEEVSLPAGAIARLIPGGVLFTADARDVVVEVFTLSGSLVSRDRIVAVHSGDTLSLSLAGMPVTVRITTPSSTVTIKSTI